MLLQSVWGAVRVAFGAFLSSIVAVLPRVLAGIVFLALAAVLVKLLMVVVRVALRRSFADESVVYRQFLSTIVAVFLWFNVGLSFLAVVGLDGIAQSLGTAAGFLALGIAYATSDMIADAVAGVYLLRDPDFNLGDRVEADGTVGTVDSIELRKSRIRVGDDIVVRGNAEIENGWTKLAASGELDADVEADEPTTEPGGDGTETGVGTDETNG